MEQYCEKVHKVSNNITALVTQSSVGTVGILTDTSNLLMRTF